MKNAFLLLSVFALLSGYASAQTYSPSLSVALTSQQPFPAEPGRNVEIEVEFRNTGLIEAKDIAVTIVPPAPFTLLPGEEEVKKFSIIKAQSSVKTSYKLHIDSSAVTNDYNVELWTGSGAANYQKEKVTVSVQGRPKIVLRKVSLVPESIDAGGTAEMSLTIGNEGTGTARHLTLYLNSTPEITPLLSDSAFYAGSLLPGGETTAKMRLSIDNSATQKTYVTKLSALYQDEFNNKTSESFDIGIPVAGTIRMEIIKTEANYARGTVEIEIANKGTAEAKSVEARLLNNVTLIGTDYTSSIKPTKKVTFTFPLQEKGLLTLEVKYTGPALQETTIKKDIVTDFKKPNGSQDGTFIVVVIVLIIAAAFYWLRRRKKK